MTVTYRGAVSSSGFWSSCWKSVVAVVVIGLCLAPFTSVAVDVSTWTQVVTMAMAGHGLYDKPGFSYPPVWGYLLEGIGGLLRATGIWAGAITKTTIGWQSLSTQSGLFAPSVSTPIVTLLFKVPLIAADITTAWAIWCLARIVGADERGAKSAALLWLWSPVVLWETDIHGAFDVLVGLVVVMALLLRLQRNYWWCGVAIALGVLLKLTPAFIAPLLLATCIWPLSAEEPRGRFRSLVVVIGGGLAASVLLVVPVLLAGHGGAMLTDVFTRAGAPSSVGGLAALGFSAFPALSWVASWALQTGSPVTHVAEVVDIALCVGSVVAWLWGPRDRSRMVALAALVLVAIVTVGPVGNPQYFLWFLPLLVAVSWNGRMWRRSIWAFGISGVIYEVALRGPLGFFGPLWAAVGSPGPNLVGTQLHWLAEHGVFGVPSAQALELTAWAMAMIGAALAAIELHRFAIPRDQVRVPAYVCRQGVVRGSTRAPILCTGLLGIICLVASSSPTLSGPLPPEHLTVRVSQAGRNDILKWRLLGAAYPGTRVSVLSSMRSIRVRQIAVYDAPGYPESGSTNYQVEGVVDHLPVDLAADGLSVPTTTVGARRLASWLVQRPATGRVLVAASGTLPRDVWGRRRDDLVPFLSAGGTLVWSGDIPGYYSVGRGASMTATPIGPQKTVYGCGSKHLPDSTPPLASDVRAMGLVGAAEILGFPGMLPTTWGWLCSARHPSPVAQSLGLLSSALHAGPMVSALRQVRGRSLGYVTDGRTSIAWIPRGKGGIVLFGGQVEAVDFSHDVAQLLGVGGAQPSLSVIDSSNGLGSGTVKLACGLSRRVEVLAYNATVGDLAVRSLNDRCSSTNPGSR